MTDNLKRLIKALKSTGLDVMQRLIPAPTHQRCTDAPVKRCA